MKCNNKDATSKTEQATKIKNIPDFGTTLDGQLNLLIFEMPNYPVCCGKGYSNIKFNDLIEKTGLQQYNIIGILEKYGLRDREGKWSSDILQKGLIVNVHYSGLDAIKNEIKYYNYDICSPYGHLFFTVFFSLLKIWKWEAVEWIKPIVKD